MAILLRSFHLNINMKELLAPKTGNNKELLDPKNR